MLDIGLFSHWRPNYRIPRPLLHKSKPKGLQARGPSERLAIANALATKKKTTTAYSLVRQAVKASEDSIREFNGTTVVDTGCRIFVIIKLFLTVGRSDWNGRTDLYVAAGMNRQESCRRVQQDGWSMAQKVLEESTP